MHSVRSSSWLDVVVQESGAGSPGGQSGHGWPYRSQRTELVAQFVLGDAHHLAVVARLVHEGGGDRGTS